MTTIFEKLREDHQLQRQLIDNLVQTHGDEKVRHQVYETLKTELQAHAAAEERFFYSPLINHDLTQEKARHSISEHHEIDEMLEKLDETEMSSPAWLATAKNLHERLHHHLDEEEREIFQVAGKALTKNEKTSLAADYQKEIIEQRVKQAS